MSIEDPNNNTKKEVVVFNERLKKINERLVALEHSNKNQGLSSAFIHNVIGNILSSVSMALELVDEPDMRAMVEGNLGLAEKYLDTLNKSEEALREEVSMTIETWSKMGQQEANHAREIIAKYRV